MKKIIKVGKRIGNQVYYFIDPPFKMAGKPFDCYPNCLTALLSVYHILYGFELGVFNSYNDLYEDAQKWFYERIKEGFSNRYKDYTNRFFYKKGINLNATLIRAGKFVADDLDVEFIKNELLNFGKHKLVPPIAVIDEHYLRHGISFGGAHSVLLLGWTSENFYVYDPEYGARIREVPFSEIAKGLKVYDYNLIILTPKEEQPKIKRVGLIDAKLSEFTDIGVG